MKIKILILVIFLIGFKIQSSLAQIAYLDINFILSESKIGQTLNNYLNEKKDQNLKKMDVLEKELIYKEELLLSQQNILEKKEFEERLLILSDEIKKYRSEKKILAENLNEIRIKNTKQILEFLNPIITNYVEKHEILIVIPKKNIIVGQKKLDITNDIIKLLNDQNRSLNF